MTAAPLTSAEAQTSIADYPTSAIPNLQDWRRSSIGVPAFRFKMRRRYSYGIHLGHPRLMSSEASFNARRRKTYRSHSQELGPRLCAERMKLLRHSSRRGLRCATRTTDGSDNDHHQKQQHSTAALLFSGCRPRSSLHGGTTFRRNSMSPATIVDTSDAGTTTGTVRDVH